MMQDKEPVFISVVLYSHNAEKAIDKKLTDLMTFLSERFKQSEIVIVDNASSDQSVALAQKLAKGFHHSNQPQVTILTLSRNHNIEESMRAGIDFAIGDFVIEIDNMNYNFPLEDLYRLYKKSAEGFDVVFLEPQKNRFSSKIFYKIINKYLHYDMTLQTEMASILSRNTLNAISRIKNKTHYRKVVYRMASRNVSSILSNSKPTTRLAVSDRINAAFDIVFSFTNIGMRINLYLTILFFGFTLLGGCYALYQFFTNDKIVEGWTSIMIFLSFGFSGAFLMVSILCKYLVLILREIKSDPIYNIKQISKIETEQ